VQVLRSEVDAIVTSGETARRDSPQLTIRQRELLEGRDQPWRVVLTSRPESLPASSPLLADEWRHRTLTRRGDDLENVLRQLVVTQGVLSVMLESGGVLAAAFLEAQLVDEAVIHLAPQLCGGPVVSVAGGGFLTMLNRRTVRFTKLGEDVQVRGLIEKK
jgi:diaminohydroxyphosphoribosylaminopyrimidine deaminase / 5-amino-6-(5-phosphoribosylamino)uracil reductase